MTLLGGLSAFPLTPLADDAVDDAAFATLVQRLHTAGVDSITALGSTGSYAYLSPTERDRVAHLAVEHAGGTPVVVGVGALRTAEVLRHVDVAVAAGAQGLLLAPMSYQPLHDDDVVELFRAVTERSELPVVLYDNPGTTHVKFSLELYGRIAALPGVAALKIPGIPGGVDAVRERVRQIREVVPEGTSIGISGDAFAATGMLGGCDTWYSVIGGTLPAPALAITRAALAGQTETAMADSDRLAPLWDLFTRHGGSLRVVAAIAEQLGLAQRSCLPLPLLGLDDTARAEVADVVTSLGLDALE